MMETLKYCVFLSLSEIIPIVLVVILQKRAILRVVETRPILPAKIDKIDQQIVLLLTRDGRMSCMEMAREIGGITERMVRYRLERLIRNEVITISAVVDPRAIGYPVIADVFIEVEPGQVNELAAKIAEFATVTYVACSTGERDISVQIVARDNRQMYEFVTDIVGRLPGVRRTTTSIVPLIVKDDAYWTIPDEVVKKD
jgi:Lrp/AsnC family transcriptional regulator for asnA, asnC and gidA